MYFFFVIPSDLRAYYAVLSGRNLKKRYSGVSNLEPDHTLVASKLHISLLVTPLDIWNPTSG